MHDLHRQSLDIPSSRLSAVDRSPSLPASFMQLQSKLREFPILQIAQTIQPFNLVNSPRIQRRVVWVQLVDGVGFGGHESSGGSSSVYLAWGRASRSVWRCAAAARSAGPFTGTLGYVATAGRRVSSVGSALTIAVRLGGGGARAGSARGSGMGSGRSTP